MCLGIKIIGADLLVMRNFYHVMSQLVSLMQLTTSKSFTNLVFIVNLFARKTDFWTKYSKTDTGRYITGDICVPSNDLALQISKGLGFCLAEIF